MKVLSCRFRKLYLRYLQQTYAAGKLRFHGELQELSESKGFARYLTPLHDSEWVVYAKAPFGGPDRVLDYLGRYTHRVAISNNRLEELKDGQVSFAYKDYKHEQRHKVMTVSADEFLRRFLLHVLPDSFQRIRHYGLLGNRHRAENLTRCRELLAMPAPIPLPRATTGKAGNTSPGTIHCSVRSAATGGWCESPFFQWATPSKDVTAHEPCNSPSHLVGSAAPWIRPSGTRVSPCHFRRSTRF